MQMHSFKDGLDKIFDMFTYTKKPTAEQMTTWYDRLKHIPDEAVNYIVENLCDSEKLPSNMPLAWKNLWGNWKSANPTKLVRNDCRFCGNTAARYCWEEIGPDVWHMFAVPCPACQQSETRAPADLNALESSGIVIMPADFYGGPMAFDKENKFGCLWPVGLDTSTQREQMRVGVDTKQDFNRVRHIPQVERDAHAEASW